MSIRIAVKSSRRYRTLVSALEGPYEVTRERPRSDAADGAAPDLWIVSAPILDRRISYFRNPDRQSPVLLIADSAGFEALDDAAWEHVDEVLRTPLRKRMVRRRVESALNQASSNKGPSHPDEPRPQEQAKHSEDGGSRANSLDTPGIFRKALDALPLDLALFDADGRFRYVNAYAISDPDRRRWVLGRTNEEYCRHVDQDPAVGRRRDQAIRQAARTQDVVQVDETLPTPDGPRHFTRIHVPIVGSDGEVEHVVGYGPDVTEQEHTRQALRQERDRFQILLESLPTPVVRGRVENGEALLITANKRFEEVFGVDSRDEKGTPVRELIVPSDQQEGAVQINRKALEEGTVEAEVQRVTESGLRDFRLHVAGHAAEQPPAGSDSEPPTLEVFGIYTDITERKRRERRALRRREKTEALYTATRRLLEAEDREEVGAAVFEVARDTFEYPGVTIRFVDDDALVPTRVSNETIQHMPERPRYSLDGNSMAVEALGSETAVHYDDVRDIGDDPVDRGDFRSVAYVPIGPHGVIVVAGLKPGDVSAGDVRLLEILGTNAAAVIDRIEQQRAVQESERTYRSVINRARDSIYVLDEEARFLGVNDSTAEMLGRSTEELIGRPIVDVLDHERTDADVVQRHFREALAGNTQRFELWAKHADGTSIPKDVLLQKAHYFGKRVVLGVGRSIENRKQRERELRRAKQSAEEASRMKSAFLANMSHEIRTPLTSIIGFADAIGEEIQADGNAADEATIARFARLIGENGKALKDTLTKVLNFSKLEDGEMSLASRAVDLAEIAEQEATWLQREAEEKNIDLQVRVASTWAQADQTGVEIVLRNLLSNAIKYTNAGGQVRVRTVRDEDTAGVAVEDTGIGMDPEVVDELFEAFRQESEGASRRYEGSGLGLSIAHRMATQMGGTIDVETEKGTGSRFTVRLPPAAPDSSTNGQ